MITRVRVRDRVRARFDTPAGQTFVTHQTPTGFPTSEYAPAKFGLGRGLGLGLGEE